ncbi:hypothetical protein ALQ04_04068 [Pseudomonas cichorii]|uniref:Uncharacterized protein n=1 Tax=Pseudomonas cichorii TaxID=36746 RepID=A0A3M4M1B1_PSECI|nr:hypothetical protein [Pseudomonas cichorii]RMQ47638.1 hypothetical protein ALQ04_04068 [Pseudomonas cichorii]
MSNASCNTASALGLWAVFLACPVQLQASGQLPPSTIENSQLPNFAACRAFLEETWRVDQAKADPQPIPEENGSRQTLIYSQGVVATDASHASYEVEEGWQFRSPLADIRQIRTAYSYERRSYHCAGRHLSGTGTSGYALDGYEAMPD